MALQRVRSNMLASDFVLTDGQGLRVGADNNLYIDTTNNRVGINTGAPDHELTVVGTVAATSFVGDGSQLTGVGASGLDTVTDVGNTTTNSITVGGLTVNSTSAARLPAGTTAERPAGSAGDIRFNSSLTKFEGYNGADWGGLGGGAAYASSAPATPQTGDLWFDTGTTGELYVYTGDEWISATGGGLTIFTSDDVPEGDDNLYYTTARANTDFDTRLATKDTDDLAEGSNLYYTQTRFDSAFSSKSTTDLTEGTRLYYTTARANSDFDSRLTLKTTTDLTEGSNLYYTDARVQTKLAAVSGSIVPDTDIAYDLGTPSKRFRELYLSGNSITIGTIRLTDNNGQFMVTDTSDNPVTAAEAENIIYDPTFSEIDAEDVQAALDIFGETRKYWSNITSAVRMYGGIIQNNGDGTVRVAGGGGLFKLEAGSVEGVPAGECEPMALNSAQGGEIFFRTWDADPVVELTNNAYNYIFIVWDHTYNNGDGTYGRARVHASTNFYMNDWENELSYYTFRAGHPELNLPERRSAMLHAFTVGRVYRMDNEIIVRVCGTNGWNYNKRAQLFGEEFFPVVRARGLEIEAASGDLQFNVTEGVMWAEAANRFTVQRFDMDDGDTFTAWYRHSATNFTGALADIQAAYPSGISGAPYDILYSTTDDRYYRYQNGSWSEVLDYVNSKVQISSSANLAALQSVYTDGFHNLDDGNDYVVLQLQATDAYYRYNSGNQTWELFTGDIHDYVQVHFIGKVADMATQYPAGYTGLINVIAPTADGKYYEYNGANGWERVHGYVNRSGWLRFYDQTAVDVTRYNDVAAQKLVDLPAGEYGVAWIYMVHDNSCHLVYGQDYYTQEEAKNAALPTPLPGLLAAYSTLVGKITFTAGVTDFANASLESPFQEKFISSGVSLHNDLAGLNGGNASTNEYYHLDETAYNLLNTFAEEIDVDASGNLAVAGVVTSTGISTSGNVELTGVLRGPSTFTIDPAAHGDATGTVVIAGNLQVDGTTTTVNSTTVTIDDKNIVLADNASTAAEANGAGITINGAGAALTYNATSDAFEFNKGIFTSGNINKFGIAITPSSTNVNEIGDYSGAFVISANTTSTLGDRIPLVFNIGSDSYPHISAAIESGRYGSGWDTYLAIMTNKITSGPEGIDAIQEVARFNGTGVGIGDPNPLGKLSVYTTSTSGVDAYNGQHFGIIVGTSGADDTNQDGNGIVFTQQYAPSNIDSSQVRTGAIIGYKGQPTGNFGGGLKFKVQPTGAAPMSTAMTLTKDSRVGVNTDTPNKTFHVVGSAHFSQSTSATSRSTSGVGVTFENNHVYNANSDIGDTNRFLAITNDSSTNGAYAPLSFRVNPNSANGVVNAMADIKLVANSSTASKLVFTLNQPNGNFVDMMRMWSDGNIEAAGNFVPINSNSQDLGSSSSVWRNIYTGDLHLSNEGHQTGNSIDGTSGNWTIQEGAEDLYIINNKTGKKYRFKLEEM